MEKPKITPWNETTLDVMEEFIVFKPTRIDPGDGKGARGFNKGDTVKLSGFAKKDLYFQNKIMYKKDYEAVVAYENSLRVKNSDSYAPEVTKESSGASISEAKKK